MNATRAMGAAVKVMAENEAFARAMKRAKKMLEDVFDISFNTGFSGVGLVQEGMLFVSLCDLAGIEESKWKDLKEKARAVIISSPLKIFHPSREQILKAMQFLAAEKAQENQQRIDDNNLLTAVFTSQTTAQREGG